MRLQHRWSTSHNYLAGITFGRWRDLLRRHRFSIDPAYAHRALFITLCSLLNSHYALRERRRYAEAVASAPLAGPPLFILGHWRSGTTLLHELLARDTRNFAFANTYQVVNPHTFLTTEATHTRRFARLVPPTRPMDNMALSFQSPQEDEFAPCLTTLCSPYLGISFPRAEADYERYLTFRRAPLAETAAWKDALLWFARKLSYKHGRPLLLKSPAHTARIRLLLDLFPEARFVHVHRHPCDVYRSTLHYYDTAVWHTYLQRPDRSAVPETILARYTELYAAFRAEQPLIPPGRFHELSFADLTRDPVRAVAGIYEGLALPGFEVFRPALQSYADSLAGYQRNRFGELAPEEKRQVTARWRESFEAWGYQP